MLRRIRGDFRYPSGRSTGRLSLHRLDEFQGIARVSAEDRNRVVCRAGDIDGLAPQTFREHIEMVCDFHIRKCPAIDDHLIDQRVGSINIAAAKPTERQVNTSSA